jgi:hypothetical protein
MAARRLSPSGGVVHEHGVNASFRRKLDCLTLARIKFI